MIEIGGPSGTSMQADVPPVSHRRILEVFSQIAARSTMAGDLDEILHLVARRLCELIEVERCCIFLTSAEDKFLHGSVGHCSGNSIDDLIKGVTIRAENDEFAAELLKTKRPVFVPHPATDPRTSSSSPLRWGEHGVLGIPLLFQGRVIGVVFLDGVDRSQLYDGLGIEVAQMFSRLAAIAIRHSWMVDRYTHRTAVIERQRGTLERLSTSHATLTRAFVSGDDLSGVVDHLVGLVQKPVMVYDEEFTLISWSAPAGLGLHSAPRIPIASLRSPWFTRQMSEQWPARSSIMIPPAPAIGLMSRRLICPLRIDGTRAGYLEVVELGQRISVVDIKVAEHGATVLALQLLTERRAAAASEQSRVDLLDDLLVGRRDHATLEVQADDCGIRLREPNVLLRVAHETAAEESPTGSVRRVRVARAIFDRTGVECLAATSVPGADIYLLGPLAEPSRAGLVGLCGAVEHALVDLSKVLPVRYGALSNICNSAAEYRRASSDVAEVIGIAAATGREAAVLLVNDFGLVRVLTSNQQGTASEQFATDLLEPILRHDELHEGDLLLTVRAFLVNDRRVRATAVSLGVHENTVRYRLSKLDGISGLDPSRVHDLLDLRLAIQLHDACRTSQDLEIDRAVEPIQAPVAGLSRKPTKVGELV